MFIISLARSRKPLSTSLSLKSRCHFDAFLKLTKSLSSFLNEVSISFVRSATHSKIHCDVISDDLSRFIQRSSLFSRTFKRISPGSIHSVQAYPRWKPCLSLCSGIGLSTFDIIRLIYTIQDILLGVLPKSQSIKSGCMIFLIPSLK